MSKLIALVDGSLYSHSVCDLAAWIAEREEAAIELLHVIGRRQAEGGAANLSGSIALGARTTLLKELSELDEQMAVTLGLMQEMSASLNTTESFLGYLSVLPGMVDHMDNMKTNIAISTDAMGCSAIFGGGSKPECQA